jgi:hypothetical protein
MLMDLPALDALKVLIGEFIASVMTDGSEAADSGAIAPPPAVIIPGVFAPGSIDPGRT